MNIILQIRTAFLLLFSFSILTGLIYPATLTLFAQVLFPWQANGSLIEYKGKIIGSQLIGQSFTNPHYFWGRPSATEPYPYNGGSSKGSNLGPSNPTLLALVKSRADALHEFDTENASIPVELVTASGSGLDPDISPKTAFYQIPRIAKARNIPKEDVKKIVQNLIKTRTFWILGEPRINVLELNMALDTLF